MTAEQFAYWLQGYVELNPGKVPDPEQWKSITEHLQTVFVKVTPAFTPFLKEENYEDRLTRLMSLPSDLMTKATC